jgi:outer membrane protein TolC
MLPSIKPVSFVVTLFLPLMGLFSVPILAETYTLQEAISKAQSLDPWITGSLKRQESIDARSVEAGALPDPQVNMGIANLPIDSLDFSQEAMTQFKVGVSQMFPRGKTLSLEQEKLQRLSEMQPYARADREAKVAVVVAELWLEALRNHLSIQLIEQDRSLFQHLVDVAQSNYTSASGRTRQQDVVRAQLELTRLDDRLTQLYLQSDVHLAKLAEWLSDPAISLSDTAWQSEPPTVLRHRANQSTGNAAYLKTVSEILIQHPSVLSLNQKLSAFDSGVEIAKQSYKPQWGLNASYAYRDDSPMGDERSDFFSVGVTFDLPIFTGNRQDKRVQSAKADLEEVKTEKVLLLRQLKAQLESTEAKYLRLVERKTLFEQRLLKEMTDQAEASLSAYTHDDGDFAEVVRARIAELNARIDALNISIDIQKVVAQLNYFYAGITSSTDLIDQSR